MNLYMIMFIFVHIYVLDVFSTYKRKCGLCLSEPSLFHLTRCLPIASIYLQTTCHYSYG
jgi:hypothetical protein